MMSKEDRYYYDLSMTSSSKFNQGQITQLSKMKKRDSHFVGLLLIVLKLFSDLPYLLWFHSKRGFGQRGG
jgi:hypothetical protein